MTIPARTALLLILATLPARKLPAQVWEVSNQLLIDSAHPSGAKLGSALAVGDFDGDGADDLAVGAPNETVSALGSAGRVRVYLSDGVSGLVLSNASIVGNEASMRLGTAVAAGDFNHDGKDELVVGAPGDDTAGPVAEAGSIRIWSLSAGVWSQIAYFDQDSTSVPDTAEANDHFGQSLAVGRFNNDLYEDLAVGVPDENIGTTLEAGGVNVLYGSASGLTGTGSQFWSRSGGGITGTAGQDQILGRALAAGDFDSDDVDDLAIGVADTFAGHVVVLYGSGSALSTAQQVIFPADFEQPPSGGQFSAALAAGDMNFSISCGVLQTCADDLIVGMPNATVKAPNMVSFFNAGAVFVLYGSESFSGLDPSTAVELTENELAHLNGPGADEHLGAAVAVGSLGGSGVIDFAFGAPDESAGGASLGGTAATLLSGASPLSSGFSQVLWEEPGFLSNPPTNFDRFGAAVAIGDFDHDGQGDLAVGIPGYNGGGINDTGAVQILYGALFAEGAESNSLTNWSNF